MTRPQVYNNGSESDTDDEIRHIPLPTGPLPGHEHGHGGPENENNQEESMLPVITAKSQTTYSSAPVIRDLFQEAAVMVPVSVQLQRQQQQKNGTGTGTETNAEAKANAKAEDKKKKLALLNRQPILEDYKPSDDEEEDNFSGEEEYSNKTSVYAPEEEAYRAKLGIKRKLEQEEEFDI